MINLIWDFIFDQIPTMDQIYQVLNSLALLNGLMLTMAAAVMNVFDEEQATNIRHKVDEFIKDGGKFCIISPVCVDPYAYFIFLSVVAFGTTTAAIMVLILMYLFIGSMDFDNHHGVHSQQAMKAWWNWCRLLITIVVALTGIGLYSLMVSIGMAWAMQHGNTRANMESLVWQSDLQCFIWLLGGGVLVPMILLSMALRAKENELERLRMEDKGEALDEFIRRVGKTCRSTPEHIDLASKRCAEHSVTTLSHLVQLEDRGWDRLDMPLRLELALREQMNSEGGVAEVPDAAVGAPPDAQREIELENRGALLESAS